VLFEASHATEKQAAITSLYVAMKGTSKLDQMIDSASHSGNEIICSISSG
jgi:hypothetical protein